uniref:Uncharacterized protein n=1 Tax=Acrobeloides nanus TaxID=290746 RepID=A0A914BZ48_9BILA
MANSSENFTVAPMPDVASPLDLVKASIYVLAAQFQLFPYVIILWIIFKDQKTYGAPVYRIIFHMGLTDCIVLIFHCTALPITIFRPDIRSWSIKDFLAI